MNIYLETGLNSSGLNSFGRSHSDCSSLEPPGLPLDRSRAAPGLLRGHRLTVTQIGPGSTRKYLILEGWLCFRIVSLESENPTYASYPEFSQVEIYKTQLENKSRI